MPSSRKQSAPPFLPPNDVPSFGPKKSSGSKRSTPLIEFSLGQTVKNTLLVYTASIFGPWLITAVSGMLLTASLAYWFAPDHAGMVVRYFMPDSVQSAIDAVTDLPSRIKMATGAGE